MAYVELQKFQGWILKKNCHSRNEILMGFLANAMINSPKYFSFDLIVKLLLFKLEALTLFLKICKICLCACGTVRGWVRIKTLLATDTTMQYVHEFQTYKKSWQWLLFYLQNKIVQRDCQHTYITHISCLLRNLPMHGFYLYRDDESCLNHVLIRCIYKSYLIIL